MYDDVMRSKASDMNDWKKEDHTMKKGQRIIALFLAVLMIATSDTGVYQAFGMDAANQASEAEKAAGGAGDVYKRQERIAMIQKANPDAKEEAIPVDLVTNSGSGLDPHILSLIHICSGNLIHRGFHRYP